MKITKNLALAILIAKGLALTLFGCDNGTTNNNNNNNNQNTLDMAALTAWVNDPARTWSVGGGTPSPLTSAARSGFIAAAPGLWGATSATYQNNHATYARMLVAFLEANGAPAPVVITQGKRFEASAIAVKNPLGEYMIGQKRERAA